MHKQGSDGQSLQNLIILTEKCHALTLINDLAGTQFSHWGEMESTVITIFHF